MTDSDNELDPGTRPHVWERNYDPVAWCLVCKAKEPDADPICPGPGQAE